jgi:NodT family efflux transporter outer membrane factor (OMF) lipoprotein
MMIQANRRPGRLLGAAATVVIAGCTVGPDFKSPPAPTESSYVTTAIVTTSKTPDTFAGGSQQFHAGQDISAEWWSLFHSAPLNALIERSLRNNPDIKAAQSALAVAREEVLAQRGAYYPSVSAGVAVSRQKTPAEISPTPNSGALNFSLYTPQVSVSYVPDVFGLNHRTVEYLNTQAEIARYALVATQITLTANIVAAALQEASLRAQIDATEQLIRVNSGMLDILRNQYGKGYAGRLDVAAQEAQLAQMAATLPPLQKQLAQQRDLLAVLSGGYPDQALPEAFTLSSLQLPSDLPLSLPSRLVEQRPDVKQAEENLHAASAQIGIAEANRLPNITLTADAGNSALALSQIFNGSTGFWDLGAALTQPIFDGGILLHKEKAARYAYDEAAAQYRSAVLTAFQNVADTLNALEQDADALKAAAAATAAAKVTFDLTQRQVQGGYAATLALSTAEIAYQQAVMNLVQAQSSRFMDTAALFQALGGGWWNTPAEAPVPPSDH